MLLDKSSFISIDLGVSRFAALVSNQAGFHPNLINGGELKRINQWYNKRSAELRSKKKYRHIASVAAKRNRKVNDNLHNISRYIVGLCLENDISKVIVGVESRVQLTEMLSSISQNPQSPVPDELDVDDHMLINPSSWILDGRSD